LLSGVVIIMFTSFYNGNGRNDRCAKQFSLGNVKNFHKDSSQF
jgi:hypothetical protein